MDCVRFYWYYRYFWVLIFYWNTGEIYFFSLKVPAGLKILAGLRRRRILGGEKGCENSLKKVLTLEWCWCYSIIEGRVPQRKETNDMTLNQLWAEHRNVKHVQLYLEGKGGNFVRNTLVVDRPINQLSDKVLNDEICNVKFSLTNTGEVLVKAVLG